MGLKEVFQKVPNIAIFSIDSDGVVKEWNDSARKLYGYSSDEAIGKRLEELIVPVHQREFFSKDLKSANENLSGEYEYQRTDGSLLFVEQNVVSTDDGVYFFSQDTSTLKTNSKLSDMVDSSKVDEKLIIISFKADGTVDSLNPVAKEITGYMQSDVEGKDFIKHFIPESYRSSVKKKLESFYDDRRSSSKAINFPIICRDGTKKIISWDKIIKSQTAGEQKIFMIGTASQNSDASLNYLANYDSLTDLPNQHLLIQNLQESINKAARYGESVITLFLNIENFKSINHTFGYNFGDKLLKEVGKRLANNLRDYDSMARFSADEFVIVFEGVENDLVSSSLVTRIQEIFQEAFKIDGNELFLQTSIGVSYFPSHANDPKSLIKYANIAMQQAKSDGGNGYKIFTASMNDEVVKKVMLENNLKKAIQNGEFYVVYQPQIDTKSKKIIGAEALVRWNHPKLNNIPPLDFIPIAEDTGMILEIGKIVLNEAISQAKKWHDKGYNDFKIAVNISGIQLLQGTLYQDIENILNKHKFDAKYLELELTESILMQNLSLATMLLDRFKQQGISISIDDFGTGYSSFGYLREMPIDLLKIDQSFINQLTTNSKDKAIVSAIMAMAHKMGIKVIAEGVEKSEQYSHLKELECNFIQGYYFSKPLKADEFEKVLEKGIIEGKDNIGLDHNIEKELKRISKPTKILFS